jgi:IMP dehydrogenase
MAKFLLSEDNTALSFDDVILVPRYSEIRSRLDTDISTHLTNNIKLDAPICSAAMDTVSEANMAKAMSNAGGIAFLHRFASDDKILEMVSRVKSSGSRVVVSVGIRDYITEWISTLLALGVDAISIDVANGHALHIVKYVELIKNTFFDDCQLIAGNVCTPEGVKDLALAGADCVRVGIGGGCVCKTRVITGCGLPSFSTILDCYSEVQHQGIRMITDGGIKNSGDVVKAIAAGADVCMVGYLLSKTKEAPGKVVIKDGVYYKKYRGMASEEVQIDFKGGLKPGTAAEGISTMVPVDTTVEKIMSDLTGGLRSGMTYCGAKNIVELRSNAVFRRISTSSFHEGKPIGTDLDRM